MASSVSLEEFKNLKEGSELKDKHGNKWIVRYGSYNKNGPNHHPTLFLFCSVTKEVYRVSHDGVSMYISSEGEKNKNGIMSSFERE